MNNPFESYLNIIQRLIFKNCITTGEKLRPGKNYRWIRHRAGVAGVQSHRSIEVQRSCRRATKSSLIKSSCEEVYSQLRLLMVLSNLRFTKTDAWQLILELELHSTWHFMQHFWGFPRSPSSHKVSPTCKLSSTRSTSLLKRLIWLDAWFYSSNIDHNQVPH